MYSGQVDWNTLQNSPQYREQICRSLYENISIRNNIDKLIEQYKLFDAECDEILQEGIVRFITAVCKNTNINIKSDVDSYVFGICKNVFYHKLRSHAETSQVDLSNLENLGSEDIDYHKEELIYNRHKELFNSLMEVSSESCQKVLGYWSVNMSMALIAQNMGYKSEMMARKKKYECVKKLMEWIKINKHLTQKYQES